MLDSTISCHLFQGNTVVVKDSDGRSSSLLVSSVAMVLMSPEYRTSEGTKTYSGKFHNLFVI